MSSLYRYPDFFDPIFDAVPKPPDPNRDFKEWFDKQRAECFPAFSPESAECFPAFSPESAECFPAFSPESAGTKGTGFRFMAVGVPMLQTVRSNQKEAYEAFTSKARAYWEAHVRQ